MAIPSGSGTEVLKRGAIDGNAAWTYARWDQAITASGNTSTGTVAIPTNCIATILNINACNHGGSAAQFAIRVEYSGSSGIYILSNSGTSIPAYDTFVYSEKIVLGPTDKLQFYNNNATDIVWCYIYQEWT